MQKKSLHEAEDIGVRDNPSSELDKRQFLSSLISARQNHKNNKKNNKTKKNKKEEGATFLQQRAEQTYACNKWKQLLKACNHSRPLEL